MYSTQQIMQPHATHLSFSLLDVLKITLKLVQGSDFDLDVANKLHQCILRFSAVILCDDIVSEVFQNANQAQPYKRGPRPPTNRKPATQLRIFSSAKFLPRHQSNRDPENNLHTLC